ncbi:Uncharacterized protein OBRU01_08947 [Operophtera brumata]|uniref:Uncharacterized protein n=1 Tax=Operophtera brumata TaxID=104452 RepID=A0A0L7LH89_OPEBR|nr:Uncharacterized protein OBRU01_08947 [Operophtera brumata]
MDVLPSGNLFRELEHVTDTGYFEWKLSLEDYWQQVLYKDMTIICRFKSDRAGTSLCREGWDAAKYSCASRNW